MSKTRKPKTVGQLQAEHHLPSDTLRNPNGTNARDDQHVSTLTNRHGKVALAEQLQPAEPDLYTRIRLILSTYFGTQWDTENQVEIIAIRMPVADLAGWEPISADRVKEKLLGQVDMLDTNRTKPEGMDMLAVLLLEYPCVGYQKEMPDDFLEYTHDLVIGLVRGTEFAGIKTGMVRT